MTTTNKDFKVKHGLAVTAGATFGQAIEIGEPSAADHAATKGYVDTSIIDLNAQLTAIVATTGNIDIELDLLPGDSIDGITLQVGFYVLVKNQVDQAENGIYEVRASGPAIRGADYDSVEKIKAGDLIYVRSGNSNEITLWVNKENISQINIDPIIFTKIFPSATSEIVVGENLDTLNSEIISSSLQSVGQLSSLDILGNLDVGETSNLNDLSVLGSSMINTLQVSGDSVFSGAVEVPEPTEPDHAASKDYVDNLINQESVEITTIDDLSNYFNGYNSRFLPTYQGFPVTLQNEFNLLLTIDGIIQSVGSPDYVWQSVMPRVGFRIDNDGYIAFPEAIPAGSAFDARVLVGLATTTQTKVYPFKAMDIVLGGY